MSRSQKHYVKSKKPETGCTPHNSIYLRSRTGRTNLTKSEYQWPGGGAAQFWGVEVAGSVTGRWSHACTCPSKWTLKICAQPFM